MLLLNDLNDFENLKQTFKVTKTVLWIISVMSFMP